MSRYSIDGQTLTDIAGALRMKETGNIVTSVSDVGYVRGSDIEGANGVKTVYYFSTPWPRTKITIESVEYLAPEVYEGADYITIYYYNSAESSYGSAKNIRGTNTLPISIIHEQNVDYDNTCPRFDCYRASEANISYTMVPVDENDEPIDLTIKPEDMADKINNMLILSEDNLVITGNCQYRFAYNGWNWIINNYSDKIITEDILAVGSMFTSSNGLSVIPFEINLKPQYMADMGSMFNNAGTLITVPVINNAYPSAMDGMFSACNSLKSFPEGFAENWDWSYLESQTNSSAGKQNSMFSYCSALRNVPSALISHCNSYVRYTSSLYYGGFSNCYNLEEIIDLAVPYNAAWTSNAFYNTFNSCNRLKNLTFKMQADSTPFVCNGWKKQTIDLTTVGYGQTCKTYNKDLTDDTLVNSAEKWNAAINGTNPNYWTSTTDEYAFYDRRAAVRTINSLPDVSGSGATNTIKFRSTAASDLSDEHKMSMLSEEEIAVAAAKGWTVSLV